MSVTIIRADAGGMTGTGHVMRMIALAQAILRRGDDVTIATVSCPSALVSRIQSDGIRHHKIPAERPGSPEDARGTEAFANSINASWIVLDGYHFDIDYQEALHSSSPQVLCLDDHGYSDRWCCDAILNQNLDAESWASYSNDIENARNLLGSSFCLLREEFLKGHQGLKTWKPIQNLLVTLGGSDPENASLAVLKVLNETESEPLNIRLIVGPDNPHLKNLRAFQTTHHLEFLSAVKDMPAQYSWADGIISAGGSTCWEWLNAGLPGAIVTIAENQEPIARAICDNHRAAVSLGWFHELRDKARHLSSWLQNPSQAANHREASKIIDGKGADRVAALLSKDLKIHILTQEGKWMESALQHLQECPLFHKNQPLIFHHEEDLPQGDILFILSYWGLLKTSSLQKHSHNLVVHESRLPQGKGWSPLTWQVLEGRKEITFTLFEAIKKVDAGEIYLQDELILTGRELIDELRDLQATKTLELCGRFVDRYPEIISQKRAQSGTESFYQRRTPDSSELDPTLSLASQFDLLRTVDNELYPAFFIHQGEKYLLKISRAEEKT